MVAVASVAPVPAHLSAQGPFPGAPAAAAGRTLPLPEVPGRHSSHAEGRRTAAAPSPFVVAPPDSAPPPDARRALVSTFLIQLVADEQRTRESADARAGPLELLRAHSAYRSARTTAGAATLARIGIDASELAAKPGTTLDTLT